MRVYLIFSTVLLFAAAAAGQAGGPPASSLAVITRSEFDSVMSAVAEKDAARSAGPNRESIRAFSAFEGSGSGSPIGSDITVIDTDSEGNTRLKTITIAGRNRNERDAVTVGRRKYERTNGGPWAVSEVGPRPAPPRPYTNPYPESAEFRAAPGWYEVSFSKRVGSEGVPPYTEDWNIRLFVHMGHLIRMVQQVRSSGPIRPTLTTIDHQFSYLPPFTIAAPPVSTQRTQ